MRFVLSLMLLFELYVVFMELFPLYLKVDARLLKAVAIEHAKDPDAAVETILTDIFPFMCEKPSVVTPIGKSLNYIMKEIESLKCVVVFP